LNPDEIAALMVTQGERLGASDACAIVTEENKRMLRFSNNSITVVQAWNTIIPIIHLSMGPKRVGCIVEDLKPESIISTIETLIKTMKLMKPGDVDSRLPKGPFTYHVIQDNYDNRVSSSMEELTDAVEAAISSAASAGAKRVSGILVATEWSRNLKTSTGNEGKEKGTMLELTVRAFVDADSSGQGVSCSTTFQNFNPEYAGSEAGKIAKLASSPIEGKEGVYQAVLAPSIMANLLNTAAASASAYSVEIGMSYFVDKLGQKVASDKFTLTDNQQYSGGPGSHAFDDEGFPTKPTTIVQNGFLKTLLHSSYTAKKFNTELTGHGYYGGASGIIPTPSNLTVDPGDWTKEELFEEVGNGIYVTNNWYTRFQNYQTGDFSTICRDGIFMISKGEVSHPVKRLRISDNMLRILKSISAISKERLWIKWWEVDTPILLSHFVIEKVRITKSTR
jgi:PmbA protein